MVKRWRLPCLVILVGGCAVTANRRHDFEKALASLAAKDLDCPATQIRMSQLGGDYVEGTDLPMYQRVKACGRQADYIAGYLGYEKFTSGGGGRIRGKDFEICPAPR